MEKYLELNIEIYYLIAFVLLIFNNRSTIQPIKIIQLSSQLQIQNYQNKTIQIKPNKFVYLNSNTWRQKSIITHIIIYIVLPSLNIRHR